MKGKTVLQNMSAYKQGMQIKEVKDKYQLDRIVKLASNENPYGCSPKVKEVLMQFQNEFEIYPDGYALNLREKVAKKHQVTNDQIVFGAGSDEIVALICRAFLEKGTNTVMAEHTFPQYKHHALIEGAEVVEVPTKAGYHHLDNMMSRIDDQTKVVWICAPDNPTGTLNQRDKVTAFLNDCPKDVLVVLDIAYSEFVAEEKQLPIHEYLKEYDNVIILKTFSKAFGIASFRVGYGLATEEIATQLNIVRGPFNITSLSLTVAEAVIEDEVFLSDTVSKNKAVRTEFESFLTNLGWTYYPSETNFLLVKTPINANIFSEQLLSYGFIVRSGDLLGYPNTVRITIGTEKDMQALQDVIQTLHHKIQDGDIS